MPAWRSRGILPGFGCRCRTLCPRAGGHSQSQAWMGGIEERVTLGATVLGYVLSSLPFEAGVVPSFLSQMKSAREKTSSFGALASQTGCVGDICSSSPASRGTCPYRMAVSAMSRFGLREVARHTWVRSIVRVRRRAHRRCARGMASTSTMTGGMTSNQMDSDP